MAEAHAKHGLKSVLRITPNDTREMVRPPRMRSGPLYEAMLATFDGCAAAGAELLSIESVGGKEVHDEALMMGDLRGVIFGLCVLGVRDMRFLWTQLDQIARKHGVHCAGDTACGFGNTAMVLAEQKMIPRVFAAVVRADLRRAHAGLLRVRRRGAGQGLRLRESHPQGHHRLPDGHGRQDRRLRSPQPAGQHRRRHLRHLEQRVGAEHQAAGRHGPHLLRRATHLRLPPHERGPGRWPRRRAALPQMDGLLRRLRDPQAYVLTPDSAIAIAQAIVSAPNAYDAGKAAALTALRLLRDAHRDGALKLASPRSPLAGPPADLARRHCLTKNPGSSI